MNKEMFLYAGESLFFNRNNLSNIKLSDLDRYPEHDS
jgi:hypothetical protein